MKKRQKIDVKFKKIFTPTFGIEPLIAGLQGERITFTPLCA
jgi:hypothetical protein